MIECDILKGMTDTASNVVPTPGGMKQTLWRNSFIVAMGCFVFFFGYVSLIDRPLSGASWAKMFAGTANFLLAMSLSLSVFGYYFNFLDAKVTYRKYLGLIGYFSALIYSFSLPFLRPERYGPGLVDYFWTSDVLLGLAAMSIFTLMACISTDRMMIWIGPARWRALLRLGYLAFFLLVVRAILGNTEPIGADPRPENWLLYFQTFDTLPPPRLLFSLVAIGVIFARLSVEFDKRQRQTVAPTPAAASSSREKSV